MTPLPSYLLILVSGGSAKMAQNMVDVSVEVEYAVQPASGGPCQLSS